MKFREFIETQAALEAKRKSAAEVLAQWDGEKGPMGLTPDHIKALPAWQAAKAAHNKAFAESRAFNGRHAKDFEGATRKLIDLKRKASLAGGSSAVFNLNPQASQFVLRAYVPGCENSPDFVAAFHFEAMALEVPA